MVHSVGVVRSGPRRCGTAPTMAQSADIRKPGRLARRGIRGPSGQRTTAAIAESSTSAPGTASPATRALSTSGGSGEAS